jgi:hypothetical protein
MRVLLKVWSSNPDYDGGCDYAAVEISEELAKLMLRRINVLSEQKALDCSLYETYYWNSSPEYFSPWAVPPVEPGGIDEAAAALEEILNSLEVDSAVRSSETEAATAAPVQDLGLAESGAVAPAGHLPPLATPLESIPRRTSRGQGALEGQLTLF